MIYMIILIENKQYNIMLHAACSIHSSKLLLYKLKKTNSSYQKMEGAGKVHAA